MHLATAHAGVMYDTLSVSGTLGLRDGEEGFGVGGLAISGHFIGVLCGLRAMALRRLPSRPHPGAVGRPAFRLMDRSSR